MKEEIAEKWIEALTSGEYTQGRYLLRSDNSFCCLGVLCDIYKKETGIGEWLNNTFFGKSMLKSYLGNSSIQLIESVREWAGMDTKYGGFPSGLDIDSLLVMNDSGKSFAEIAEVIKEKMEVL